jgi:hypothetical protein
MDGFDNVYYFQGYAFLHIKTVYIILEAFQPFPPEQVRKQLLNFGGQPVERAGSCRGSGCLLKKV